MKSEIKSTKTEKSEVNVEMSIRKLETLLYETQEEINKLQTAHKPRPDDLEVRKNQLIDLLALKAGEMKNKERYNDVFASMLYGVGKDYDQIIEKLGDGHENQDKIMAGVEAYIDSLKKRVKTFVEDIKPEKSDLEFDANQVQEGGLFDPTDLEKILSMMDGCVTTDRAEFISKLSEALRPLADYQINNPKSAERAKRKSFLRSSIGKEQFYPIKGTDNILSYGIGGRNGDSLHLHLAPMRTVEDKHNFMYVVMKKAFEDVAEVVKANNQVKVITATSYLVAARPSYYKELGFELEALSPSERRHSWGVEERPILRAYMDREKFIKLFEKKDN